MELLPHHPLATASSHLSIPPPTGVMPSIPTPASAQQMSDSYGSLEQIIEEALSIINDEGDFEDSFSNIATGSEGFARCDVRQ